MKEMVDMCTEAEEKEKREGWNIDDILEELRDRREAQERKKAESGGWMVMFRKKKMPECLDNTEEAEIKEVDCFLCQEKLIVKSREYSKHLEKQHGVIFGVKEILKAGDKYFLPNEEPDHETMEAEQEVNTDSDTVNELVEFVQSGLLNSQP